MASEGLNFFFFFFLVKLKERETAGIESMDSFSLFEDLKFKRCFSKVIAHIFSFNDLYKPGELINTAHLY